MTCTLNLKYKAELKGFRLIAAANYADQICYQGQSVCQALQSLYIDTAQRLHTDNAQRL